MSRNAISEAYGNNMFTYKETAKLPDLTVPFILPSEIYESISFSASLLGLDIVIILIVLLIYIALMSNALLLS
jgi:hypothetical protein